MPALYPQEGTVGSAFPHMPVRIQLSGQIAVEVHVSALWPQSKVVF